MIGKIRKILGIDKLEQRIDTLENKIITTAESVRELRKDMENYIKQLNEEKVSASVLQEYTIRLKQIEDKLDSGLIIPGNSPVTDSETLENNIEEDILNIIINGNEVCISEIRDILNISNRKLYDILTSMEKSGKIKRKKKGKKVIIQVLE